MNDWLPEIFSRSKQRCPLSSVITVAYKQYCPSTDITVGKQILFLCVICLIELRLYVAFSILKK